MKKPSISVPHIKLSKKVGILLGTCLVLAIVLAGLAATEAHQKAENRQKAVAAAEARQADADRIAHEQAVENKLVRVTTQRNNLCAYISSVAQAKQTRGLITTPTLDCAK